MAGLYKVAPFSATTMSKSLGRGNTSNKLANVRPVSRITRRPEARNRRSASIVAGTRSLRPPKFHRNPSREQRSACRAMKPSCQLCARIASIGCAEGSNINGVVAGICGVFR
jgi:hypothetical protein